MGNCRWRSAARLATGPAEVAPLDLRMFELRAHRALGACRKRAAAGGPLPQRHEIVDSPIRRQMAIIGAIVFQELAHLVETRVNAKPNPRFEAIGIGIVGGVFV